MTPADLARVAPWAAKLKEEECKHVAPSIRLRELRRGEHLMHLDDRVDAWHGAVTGVLRVGMVSDDGQIAGFSAILGGAWFGEGSILKHEPRRYDVVAVTDASVAVLPGEMFRWLYSNSPGFNQYLVHLLNERLGHFIATVVSDRTGESTARLAYTIASLYNPVLYPNTPEVLVMPQEDLGIFAGLSRQMTNRCLKTLADTGLVELTDKGVKVLDVKGLATYGGPEGTCKP
jgi:CRP/FNR family transcriptional regulator, cyclic AMP receptor protein